MISCFSVSLFVVLVQSSLYSCINLINKCIKEKGKLSVITVLKSWIPEEFVYEGKKKVFRGDPSNWEGYNFWVVFFVYLIPLGTFLSEDADEFRCLKS